MKGITLGQYYPANSLIHKLDPRTKIILTILYIVCTFLCKSVVAYGTLFLLTIITIMVSMIPIRIIVRSLRPILFVLAFTMVVNIFWTKGDTILLDWKFIHIYKEGILNAVLMSLRIIMLIVGTCVLLTYTTTPIALTDAIEQLLKPLKVIHLPVHEFAMMMTIALRFIPTLMEETEKIMAAQKARGADFSNGSLLKRIKALIPILVPLFVSSFRRADELATAMECRCYHGDKGRTRMNILHFHAKDFIMMVLFVGIGVGIVFLNKITFGLSL